MPGIGRVHSANVGQVTTQDGSSAIAANNNRQVMERHLRVINDDLAMLKSAASAYRDKISVALGAAWANILLTVCVEETNRNVIRWDPTVGNQWFQILLPGWYLVTAEATLAEAAGGRGQIAIGLNSVPVVGTVREFAVPAAAGATTALSTTCVIECNVNDVITLMAQRIGAAAINLLFDNNMLTVRGVKRRLIGE